MDGSNRAGSGRLNSGDSEGGVMPSAENDADITEELLARIAADDGTRHDLDDVIEAFGYSRTELDADEDDFNQCPHEVIRATCPGCTCPCNGCERWRERDRARPIPPEETRP